MSDQRTIAAIVLSLATVQIGLGALGVYVPLSLHEADIGAASIGVVVALHGLGFVLGLVIGPRLVAMVGHIRAFVAFIGAMIALTLCLYVNTDAGAWAMLRLLSGVCAAGLLAAGESWIADVAPLERRGALIGSYQIASMLGFLLGPLTIAGAEIGGAGGLMTVVAVLALCLTPVALTRPAPVATPSEAAAAPRVLLKATPSAFFAALVAGAANGAVLGLAPIYAARFDAANPGSAAAYFQLAMLVGGLVAQFPIGMASNRTDRRTVLLGLAGAALVLSLMLALLPPSSPLSVAITLAALWGAGAFSMYGVAAAHAADRADKTAVAGMLGGVLVTASFGAVIGPLLAGVVMETGLNGPGLFLFAAVMHGLLAVAIFRRRGMVEPTADADKKPFCALQPTSLAAIEMDPRANEDKAPEPQ